MFISHFVEKYICVLIELYLNQHSYNRLLRTSNCRSEYKGLIQIRGLLATALIDWY